MVLREQGAIEALGGIGGGRVREQNSAVRVEQQSGWRPVQLSDFRRRELDCEETTRETMIALKLGDAEGSISN